MSVEFNGRYKGIIVYGMKVGCKNQTEITNSKSQITNNIQ